ncbi:hypothetical protein [Nesterenkonia sp. AN1]|uniref:hypothetical protein n=1 Tax=Nesterenkonia sp. AN1 TaxID=652017 RepID=UPI001268F803|nr:hypothetical protein [Nesterenkonia sp. AN1]
MRAKAATCGSVGTALLIFGLSSLLGAAGSVLLGTLGGLGVAAGIAFFVIGVVLYFRDATRDPLVQSNRRRMHPDPQRLRSITLKSAR